MENSIPEKKKDKTNRERQTYYRVAFKNNCNLLQIADNKANIIITINSLVISSTIAIIGYGSISNKFVIDSFITVGPILLFLGVILASTMLAVQAAKPTIIGNGRNRDGKPRSSLMFFGESSKYQMEDYLTESRKMLSDKISIEENMSISLYYQGKVMDRKYKLIRKSYEMFVLGLALGIVIFVGYLVY